MAHGESTVEQIDRERAFLRVGGACAIVGGLGFLAVGGLHGDLPDDSVAAALSYVADRPHWYATHLAGIVCALLWVAAFAGLAQSLRTGLGWVLGRLATLSMAMGAAVFALDYTIDGYAFKRVADAWAEASGPEADTQLRIAEAMFAVLYGTVTASATWTLGLPFLLLGLAVAAGSAYPRWLGRVVAVTGGGTMLGGMATFLGWDTGFVVALALHAVSSALLGAIGVLMWRRGGAAQA